MPVGRPDAATPTKQTDPPINRLAASSGDVMPTVLPVAECWFVPEGKVVKALPAGYTIRPLQSDDYDRGYLACLAQLTTVGDISRQNFLRTPAALGP